jgi:CelD/BcsL family acetyltransferase involved in cellulose biosynthesis
MLTVQVVANCTDLEKLASEWCGLISRVDYVTPFQTPPWLLTWWSHFGSGHVQVLVFRDGRGLVGVIPCFLHEWEGRRQLTLIGSGISDYPEPVIDPRHASDILVLFQEHLLASPDWDIGNFQDLSESTPLRALVSSDRLQANISKDDDCSRIPLTGTFEEFWSHRPKDLRRNVRRYGEKARSIGDLTFEIAHVNSNELVDALVDLHEARWQARGEAGMIQANHSAGFTRDVNRLFSSLGMLLVMGLRFQGAVVAVLLNFVYRDVVYSYLSAFDPKYETLGFGRALLYEGIRYSYERRYKEWHFLRGDEPYKASWGAQTIPKCRLVFTRRS